jgi:hypothetical protein
VPNTDLAIEIEKKIKYQISPTYQRFLKPLKSCDIVKNDDDITSCQFQ